MTGLQVALAGPKDRNLATLYLTVFWVLHSELRVSALSYKVAPMGWGFHGQEVVRGEVVQGEVVC